ncbi:MAG: hypothetical protein GY853_13650 [PVC group bacterium]|nr:hypothetical protein [PVC group bacterium]
MNEVEKQTVEQLIAELFIIVDKFGSVLELTQRLANIAIDGKKDLKQTKEDFDLFRGLHGFKMYQEKECKCENTISVPTDKTKK